MSHGGGSRTSLARGSPWALGNQEKGTTREELTVFLEKRYVEDRLWKRGFGEPATPWGLKECWGQFEVAGVGGDIAGILTMTQFTESSLGHWSCCRHELDSPRSS